MPQINHILVPTDGSELSIKAAEYAKTLAASCGARVSLVRLRFEFPTVFLTGGAWPCR